MKCTFTSQQFNKLKKYIKEELQRENKLISYERAFKMLENDMFITGVGQTVSRVIKLLSRVRESPKGNLLTSEIFGNLTC